MNPKVLLCLVLPLLIGCHDRKGGKQSHFEHDHHVAHHWPRNLQDASRKIRVRIKSHSEDGSDSESIYSEIVDLVSWVPEISADTDITEKQWIPINDRAQAIRSNLNAASSGLTADDCEQLESLCVLIEEVLKTPKRKDDSGNQSREVVH